MALALLSYTNTTSGIQETGVFNLKKNVTVSLLTKSRIINCSHFTK